MGVPHGRNPTPSSKPFQTNDTNYSSSHVNLHIQRRPESPFLLAPSVTMAPLKPRISATKDRFSAHFSQQKPQAYSDTTSSRAVSSHKYVDLHWTSTIP